VLHHPTKPHRGDIVKRDHHLETAGLNLQQVELLDARADGPAADLLDDSYAMVGVNDFIAYVEIAVAGDHEGHPKGADRKYYYLLQFSSRRSERQRIDKPPLRATAFHPLTCSS